MQFASLRFQGIQKKSETKFSKIHIFTKIYVYPQVYCSIIYNSQDIEATSVFTYAAAAAKSLQSCPTHR